MQATGPVSVPLGYSDGRAGLCHVCATPTRNSRYCSRACHKTAMSRLAAVRHKHDADGARLNALEADTRYELRFREA